jgi:hypothetical protein
MGGVSRYLLRASQDDDDESEEDPSVLMEEYFDEQLVAIQHKQVAALNDIAQNPVRIDVGELARLSSNTSGGPCIIFSQKKVRMVESITVNLPSNCAAICSHSYSGPVDG